MTISKVQWPIYLGMAAIEVALLYKLIVSQPPTSSTELIAAICVVGILLLLTGSKGLLEVLSVRGPGGFEITAKLNELDVKTSRNKEEIEKLILLSMGEETYRTLKKLAEGTFLEFQKPHYEGLETELYYLRNLGYVRLRQDSAKSIFSIPEKPESGDPLSNYIEVTREGRRYIELREQALREQTAS